MKITKLIREYVTNTITEAYKKQQNPYSNAIAEEKEKLENFERNINEMVKNAENKFFIENAAYYDKNYWSGEYDRVTDCGTKLRYSYYTESETKAKQWNEEHDKACQKDINGILLNLELGANRQELDDMMKEVINRVGKEI